MLNLTLMPVALHEFRFGSLSPGLHIYYDRRSIRFPSLVSLVSVLPICVYFIPIFLVDKTDRRLGFYFLS